MTRRRWAWTVNIRKASPDGSGSPQTRGAGTQNFSNVPRTRDRARWATRILSNVCFHSRSVAQPGSTVARASFKTTAATSSATRAWPRSTSAAASEDLPSPLRPSSSAAQAPRDQPRPDALLGFPRR